MHSLVIVESPAKAKTINKYLGPDYEVLASYGHVRDLPAKDGSVDPEADFRMIWEVEGKANQRLNEIARAVKNADRLILATDPDREGEAISWHVLEVLRAKKAIKDQAVERVVFNAITKQAVLDAMKKPREIDVALVDAYLARRALDYLVGFTLSPVLWRKLPGARSAGRVQSVALRLVCDREMEIERFVPREYWSLTAKLATPRGEEFEARISSADGKKLGRLDVPDEATATALKQAIEASALAVASVEAKPGRRNPPPPFTTSTLQQEASRKLGFAPNRTMQIAQRLYEGIDLGGETVGLITYMRTDGVDMDPGAVQAVRALVGSDYGTRYVPEAPRKYSVKAKNAQEAHEAVRPTDPRRSPAEMARRLDDDQARLYELIWKRTVASQMESAEVERTTVDISAAGSGRPIELRATGTVVTFDGFLKLYQEGRDDEGEDEDGRLPQMSAGEALKRLGPVSSTQHFTEPPPRYTEAALVKRMEELGIGRPSTYAATLAVLRDRDYVKLDKKRLVPDDKGRLVTAFLESFFERYVEYDFTAALEEQLDKISNHELDWKEVLRAFWKDFAKSVDDTKELRFAQVIDALNAILGPYIFPAKADGSDPRVCPTCGTGQLSLKLGKYGSFIGCSNYPECRFTRPLGAELTGEEGSAAGPDGVKVLGKDPETDLEVTLRDGRFGVYVQLGEPVEKEKPKRATIPSGWSAAELDLEGALKLLSLPRLVGQHPETGKPIEANIGRYGPYVSHDGLYANLESAEEVFSVGLNRAVAVIADKLAKRGGGRGAAAAGRALGDHPEGGPVTVHAGRYGPYVKHGKVNATLPKGVDPEALTLDEAVKIVDAKAAQGGGKKPARKPAAKTSAKKASTKKAPAKKSATKKPAARAAE
jgi:DNA topoisomerase-1